MVTPLFNAMQNDQSATAPTKKSGWCLMMLPVGGAMLETGTAIKSLAAEFARELYQSALIEAATKEPENRGKTHHFKRGGTW